MAYTILYIATSQDGFIADKQGNVDWLPQEAPELLGGAELVASFQVADFIDECIITIIPKILHEGIALPSNLLNSMSKVASRQFFQEIVEKRYIRKKD